MKENEEKLIQDWQEKVRSSFGDSSKLHHYLFETMDNFHHRYLETTLNQDIRTQELGPHLWGAVSFESDMVQALKTENAEAKAVIMELAKSIPKSQEPKVRYTLQVKIVELTPEHGHLIFEAEVLGLRSLKKEVTFQYQDFSQFRKELALRLEETCSLFL